MKILVSAIEPSANIHLKELQKHLSNCEFIGIFDKSLGNPIIDLSGTSIMGVVDILKKIKFFLKLKKEMVSLAKNADKVLLMDSSGFNLPLAKELKKEYPNLEINYYILPQAWAWRQGRIKIIEQYCDKLYSILPFEKNYYTQKEKIIYVGHPLLDEIPNFRTEIKHSNKIVYMPGSRRNEIKKLMPVFKETANILSKTKEHILLVPKNFKKESLAEIYGDTSDFIISYETHKELYEAEFAFICSGTATLEAGLIGTPFVLTYIAKPLDYFVCKFFFNIKTIGLANIFFQKMGADSLHKELVQENVTVQNLIKEYESKNSSLFLSKSLELRRYLLNGSSNNVANLLMENKVVL